MLPDLFPVRPSSQGQPVVNTMQYGEEEEAEDVNDGVYRRQHKSSKRSKRSQYAYVLYDYKSSDERDLTLHEGVWVKILSDEQEGYLTVEYNGAIGTFPASYLQMESTESSDREDSANEEEENAYAENSMFDDSETIEEPNRNRSKRDHQSGKENDPPNEYSEEDQTKVHHRKDVKVDSPVENEMNELRGASTSTKNDNRKGKEEEHIHDSDSVYQSSEKQPRGSSGRSRADEITKHDDDYSEDKHAASPMTRRKELKGNALKNNNREGSGEGDAHEPDRMYRSSEKQHRGRSGRAKEAEKTKLDDDYSEDKHAASPMTRREELRKDDEAMDDGTKKPNLHEKNLPSLSPRREEEHHDSRAPIRHHRSVSNKQRMKHDEDDEKYKYGSRKHSVKKHARETYEDEESPPIRESKKKNTYTPLVQKPPLSMQQNKSPLVLKRKLSKAHPKKNAVSEKERSSAIVIQSSFRGRRVRNSIEMKKEKVVKIQKVIRGNRSRTSTFEKRKQLAAESGVLIACKKTIQGQEGWYAFEEDQRYYFSVDVSDNWELIYGPMSSADYEEYSTRAIVSGGLIALPGTDVGASGQYLNSKLKLVNMISSSRYRKGTGGKKMGTQEQDSVAHLPKRNRGNDGTGLTSLSRKGTIRKKIRDFLS